jgi:hypothetical protein
VRDLDLEGAGVRHLRRFSSLLPAFKIVALFQLDFDGPLTRSRESPTRQPSVKEEGYLDKLRETFDRLKFDKKSACFSSPTVHRANYVRSPLWGGCGQGSLRFRGRFNPPAPAPLAMLSRFPYLIFLSIMSKNCA